ncbi:MAG: hypothetical protein DRN29_07080 [Thermoplasmata archaeon]|nr:MAG: hypothetical protein DRN29_07080 [Thermoplasmata archaeon]
MRKKRYYFLCPICKQIYSCSHHCQEKGTICECEECLKKNIIAFGVSEELAESFCKDVKRRCQIKKVKDKKKAVLYKLRIELEGKKL